jgi:hypothetical protein
MMRVTDDPTQRPSDALYWVALAKSEAPLRVRRLPQPFMRLRMPNRVLANFGSRSVPISPP